MYRFLSGSGRSVSMCASAGIIWKPQGSPANPNLTMPECEKPRMCLMSHSAFVCTQIHLPIR